MICVVFGDKFFGMHLGALCERLDGAFCLFLDCFAAANSLSGDS